MKKVICDCCGEEWEESFICDKCSGMKETYDENGDVGEYQHFNICLNCCDCAVEDI